MSQLLVFSWRIDAEVEEAELYDLIWLCDKTVEETIDLLRYEVGKFRRHENSTVRPTSAVEDDTRARFTNTHTRRQV